MTFVIRAALAALVISFVTQPSLLFAQDWPKQPIRIFRKRAFRWAANTTAGMAPPPWPIRRRTAPRQAVEIAGGWSYSPNAS